jgi:hypothetical protein
MKRAIPLLLLLWPLAAAYAADSQGTAAHSETAASRGYLVGTIQRFDPFTPALTIDGASFRVEPGAPVHDARGSRPFPADLRLGMRVKIGYRHGQPPVVQEIWTHLD